MSCSASSSLRTMALKTRFGSNSASAFSPTRWRKALRPYSSLIAITAHILPLFFNAAARGISPNRAVKIESYWASISSLFMVYGSRLYIRLKHSILCSNCSIISSRLELKYSSICRNCSHHFLPKRSYISVRVMQRPSVAPSSRSAFCNCLSYSSRRCEYSLQWGTLLSPRTRLLCSLSSISPLRSLRFDSLRRFSNSALCCAINASCSSHNGIISLRKVSLLLASICLRRALCRRSATTSISCVKSAISSKGSALTIVMVSAHGSRSSIVILCSIL